MTSVHTSYDVSLHTQVPLIVFKREKEIARRLEAKQMWVWHQPKSPGIANLWEWGVADWWAWLHDMWDGFVISAPSVPRNYWDKQVKDRVRPGKSCTGRGKASSLIWTHLKWNKVSLIS